jgi:hypothetical protein
MLQISDELAVKFFSASILFFSLRSLIKNRLRQVIGEMGKPVQAQRFKLGQPSDLIQHFADLEVIPLHQVKDMTRVAYQSAIALKFANWYNLSATDLAQQIVIKCTLNSLDKENNYPPLDRIYQHLAFQVQPSGQIEIELTDPGIALWLQMLINRSELSFSQSDQHISPTSVGCKNDSNFFQNAIDLFEIQYVHARCCALLRFGSQAGLIDFNYLSNLLYPSPFPWLTIDDQSLRLQHPDERRLIQQISVVLDQLSDRLAADLPRLTNKESTLQLQTHACLEENAVKNLNNRSQEILKLAQSLSQPAQVYQATCCIWEHGKGSDLAQSRLGLTLVTQIVLRMLLEKELGVTAPIEL